MDRKIAKFEKVSFEEFKSAVLKHVPQLFPPTPTVEANLRSAYDAIKLPERGTAGSAGYDIFAPFDFTVDIDKDIVIPTGIRCKIEDGWFLDINPRSGQGFKHGIHLANTRGIIDSDYYNADNEGHIMVKLVNDSATAKQSVFAHDQMFSVEQGKAFCQGIFTIYGLTVDDNQTDKRTGGFGSTDNK